MANFAGTGLRYIHPVEVISMDNDSVSDTINLVRHTFRNDSQRWTMTISLEPVAGDSAAASRLAVHRAQNKFVNTFAVEMPQHNGSPATGALSSISVDGDHDAGSDSISVDGATGAVEIGVGRFITFDGHDKVYMVTGDLSLTDVDSSGDLTIYPPLVGDIDDDSTIDFSPDIMVRYDTNERLGVRYMNGTLVRETVNLVEALED